MRESLQGYFGAHRARKYGEHIDAGKTLEIHGGRIEHAGTDQAGGADEYPSVLAGEVEDTELAVPKPAGRQTLAQGPASEPILPGRQYA